MADLTTTARVKSYIGLTSNGADSVISDLIPRASRLIEQYTSRKFPVVTRTAKRLNGTGTARLTLPDQPIVSVASVSVGPTLLTPSVGANQPTGYTYDRTTLYLTDGTVFNSGLQNVTATWIAGYAGSETDTIPTGNTPTLSPTSDVEGDTGAGLPVVNISVTSAAGLVFTEVSNGPVAGQYTFVDGVYTFNSADASTAVTMAYYYVPAPVEQACIEIIGLALKRRTNLGSKNQSLGEGAMISLELNTISDGMKQMLNPFRRMSPV